MFSGVGFLHLRLLALSELCLEQVVLIKLTQPSLGTSAGQMVHAENKTLEYHDLAIVSQRRKD